MYRMTWRGLESFFSRVSGSGLHSGCSLAQSSNLSIGFQPVFIQFSISCLMCMSDILRVIQAIVFESR
jgi:hypothetical protein